MVDFLSYSFARLFMPDADHPGFSYKAVFRNYT